MGSASSNVASIDKHPRGLYVLFATEMWERFSFYTMLALFTLYLRNRDEGFGWTAAEATTLFSNYMMFVYASPLVGGWLANWKLGFRRSVMIGGLFFIAGHLLLSFHSLLIVYVALACLVVGNGFFKPNISAMVGNLYPPGSPLKSRAYNIFYMGINIGAFLAPVTAEIVKAHYGFHAAFAVAAGGMVLSVLILWWFQNDVETPDGLPRASAQPGSVERQPIDSVPDWLRISVLIVVFLIVIVFWMVFHQNGTTLLYWADENTDWNVSGTISHAINPFWVVTLTFPLIAFWNWLNRRGWEPATPTKMACGMLMTSLAFLILFAAAKVGEASVTDQDDELLQGFKVSPVWLVGAYAVLTLGELMLSPMGLTLVAKVSPPRYLGLMMGGWFVATAIGNKLTQIGVYWEYWRHSTFWLVLSGLALAIAIVVLVLLRWQIGRAHV